MSEDFNLFEREEAQSREARAYLAQGCGPDCAQRLEQLLDGYDRLLRETRQLIRIADRRELELNRLNKKLQALTRSLAFQAEHDALTGILNKAAIVGAIERRLAAAPSCLLALDVDHFKAVNDNFGHLVGDLVLKGIADRILGVINDNDVLGRFGGEEFLVLTAEASLSRARVLAERVRLAVAEESFDIGNGNMLAVTVSIGLCGWRAGDTPDQAIERADQALYVAKRGGRNRVEVSD